MIKAIILLAFVIVATHLLCGQEVPIPYNYSIVSSVSGDLDNDSTKELVVVYNTKPESDNENIPRELIIYKLDNIQWVEWKKSSQALYRSQEGGMMGDPFETIEIKQGKLYISQSGGTSWKWGFTDVYQFYEDEFYLIGYKGLAGKICEYWKHTDCNILTGKMIVKKEYEECVNESQNIYKKENETFIKKGIQITIQKRQEREIKFSTPKYGHEIFI